MAAPVPRRAGWAGRVARGAWERRDRAARSAVCAAIPLATGAVLGDPAAGATAALGGFAGFVAHDAPYRRRAGLVAGLGIALAVVTGAMTVAAASAVAGAIALGLVVAGAAAWALATELGPPREHFVTLVGATVLGLPLDAADAPRRVALVLAGAACAWVISMAGALRDPHRPEASAVDAAVQRVAALLDAIGTPASAAREHEAVLAVGQALGAVAASVTPGSPIWQELRRRADTAEAALEAAIGLVTEGSGPLDPRWGAALRDPATGCPPPAATPDAPAGARLRRSVERACAGADPLLAESPGDGGEVALPRRGGEGRARAAALRDPVLAVPALRIGATVAVGVGLGRALGLTNPGWVAVTASAVLQGSNLTLTVGRAGHRVAGTLAGLGIAAALLAADPPLAAMIAALALLQLLVEATVVVSYAVAVTAMTPLALGLLALAHPALDAGDVLGGRVADTLIGCALGVAVAAIPLPGRGAARLPVVQAAALRAAGAVLEASLLHRPARELRARQRSVRQTLLDLAAVQRDAVGDLLTGRTEADDRWPLTAAIQRLGTIAAGLSPEPRTRLADGVRALELSRLIDELAEGCLEGGAAAADLPRVPDLPAYPRSAAALGTIRDLLVEELGVPAARGDGATASAAAQPPARTTS